MGLTEADVADLLQELTPTEDGGLTSKSNTVISPGDHKKLKQEMTDLVNEEEQLQLISTRLGVFTGDTATRAGVVKLAEENIRLKQEEAEKRARIIASSNGLNRF